MSAMKIRPEDKPPKRPKTAWILFFQKFMGEQVKEGNKFSVTELSKNASVVWKAMSEEEKKVRLVAVSYHFLFNGKAL